MERADDTPLSSQDLAEIARARASFLSFLNVHFTTLPDLRFVDRIRSEDFISALAALERDEVASADTTSGSSKMLSYIRSTGDMDAAMLSEELGVDRTKLYRGVSPGYGPEPPYEAMWIGSAGGTTAVLQTLAQTYHEAGMTISPDAMERLDYLGIEMEYQRLLAVQEAEGWDAGEEERARELLKRQAEFMGGHVGIWVPAFIGKALEHAGTDFYQGHLMMLRGFVADEQERLDALLEEVQ